MGTQITATIPLPGTQFSTNFYIRATIDVTSFGEPETGRGYLADPAGYDLGAGAEWSITGTPELYLDSGGDGERVLIGPEFAEALKAFIERDSAASDAAEREIANHAKEGVVP